MDAEGFCSFMWHTYLEKKDRSGLDHILKPGLTMIGPGTHQMAWDMEQVRSQMKLEQSEKSGLFKIVNECYQTTDLGHHLYLIMGELWIQEVSEEPLSYDTRLRFTVVAEEQAGGSWRVIHIHQSVPDPSQGGGESYPRRLVRQSNRKLKEMLEIQRKELEDANQKTLYYARYDYLTDLMNRPYLESKIHDQMVEKPCGIMMMMDVDDFKQVNDRHGHPFGDQVLSALAVSLKRGFPDQLAGRIGGDEFLVYAGADRLDMDGFLEMTEHFQMDWIQRQEEFGLDYRIGICMGIAVYPIHGNTYESLWHNADKALYCSKRNGKSAMAFAEPPVKSL